jgi:branched-chain amino acid aminotransferase
MVFHYGQAMFEGLKAYKAPDGGVLLFRPEMNVRRLNATNDRLCIPQIEESVALEAFKAIVRADADWIPEAEGTSLYIRPFIIATDPFLGVRASGSYLFLVILSPVGAYYPEGLSPSKIFVENEYVRAVRGGIGAAKAGGNYAASLKSQAKAKAMGYTQVLWLDGITRKNIDEVGVMNIFFAIGGTIVTPALDGSILPGVTRASCIEMLRSWGYPVEERAVSIEEVMAAGKDGRLTEAFGTGTAAVISPVGELNNGGDRILINGFNIGEISQRLYSTLTGIQRGKTADPFGWIQRV